jgi:glycosidase
MVTTRVTWRRPRATRTRRRPHAWIQWLGFVTFGCHSPPSGTPHRASLELSPVDADVWASEIDVSGLICGDFTAEHCELELPNARVPLTLRNGQFHQRISLTPGSNQVRARCSDGHGGTLHASPVSYHRPTSPELLLDATPQQVDRSWFDSAVVYGIYPPLYGHPPLQSVTHALSSLSDLGVDAIWIAPLMQTTAGNFGYAVTDYFKVRSDYGGATDLAELVEHAHGLKLRVLLDFVPNHTSERHPYFVQAQQFGTRSHYFDFYERNSNGESLHYFDWNDLPNLNYRHPEVRTFITAAARSWLERFGIDGLRVDAAWGVAERQPDFYAGWARRLASNRQPPILIAEASARDPYYLQHGFDAAYDWTSELGQWSWKNAFESAPHVALALRRALSESITAAGRADRVLRFLNNNDTGARFVTRHGISLTKAATVALLTLPGLPCLYSFDEVGAEFDPYGSPAPIQAPPHPELRAFHRRLIALRHDVPALHGPWLELLDTGNDNVLAYTRWASANSAHRVLVLINFSNLEQRSALPLLEPGASHRARDLYEPSLAPLDMRKPSITLPAFGFLILEPIQSSPTEPQ